MSELIYNNVVRTRIDNKTKGKLFKMVNKFQTSTVLRELINMYCNDNKIRERIDKTVRRKDVE